MLGLRWLQGGAIILVIAAPWFLYMWRRFGGAFVDGYVLNENLRLFSQPLYGNQPGWWFYLSIVGTGLLPWTWLVVGRGFDRLELLVARRSTSDPVEALLWSWVAAIVGFFSLSQFKLDHYVFPAAPALALLCAHAWNEARTAEEQHIGITVGLVAVPLVLLAAGIVLIPGLSRVPLELPPAARLLPIALIASGIAMFGQVAGRWRPSAVPLAAVAGLLASYAMVITIGLPAFEVMKPTRRLARSVAGLAGTEDQVAMYRLNRWSSSWRFYVGRHSERLETADQLRGFLSRPGRKYCAMLRRDYDRLTSEGFRLRIVHSEQGLFTTTGRSLRSGAGAPRDEFIVVTEELAPSGT